MKQIKPDCYLCVESVCDECAPSGYEGLDRRTKSHIETLEYLSSQYLPGGPRDIKGALREAIAALASAKRFKGEYGGRDQ